MKLPAAFPANYASPSCFGQEGPLLCKPFCLCEKCKNCVTAFAKNYQKRRKALKIKGKIVVEKPVGSVDNSLKCRLTAFFMSLYFALQNGENPRQDARNSALFRCQAGIYHEKTAAFLYRTEKKFQSRRSLRKPVLQQFLNDYSL
ncbi:MAG: hypothetical protein E7444_04800 [Ruminococcaceae bacterium]|nr:hypothetical protein [Oscillospiraceae bacterium]